ncbi:glycosyltransferase family 4 protein [Sphingomonas sp. SUN019]|uniref:glycosyltransferase family 4 protein n=1 Tax=Sphingomonas sp. SUN019 TaxID=2937788 RepID=UPI0021640C63|nr:glycosyltransferase family 4 protein [Sphingomonas sp. SUN019]UVO51477.1 glycosyltransferase family 4 protein [Sphingomonas sp. SUN019]
MHVAYYSPAWPPAGAANGIVTYVYEMRRHLLGEGHDVSVLAGGKLYTGDGREHDLTEAGVGPLDLWRRVKRRVDHVRGDLPFTAVALARQLSAARRIARFDLVEMEESFGWSYAAQRRLDVPVLTRLHCPEFRRCDRYRNATQRRQSRERMAAEGRAIRTARAVSAPTKATLQATRDHYRQTLPSSRVIPNPVQPRSDDQRWQPDRTNTILFVGRFDHLKGADTMLDAFGLLAARRRDVRLVMVGPDSGVRIADDRQLGFDDYMVRHVDPSVRSRVEFTGVLPPDRIAQLRQRAALTVVASRSETFSYTAVEAMAIGCPLISTDWVGSNEVIEDGETGWLTPVGCAERLAERIDWLLDHPDEAARTGAAAWRRCRDVYAPDKVGRQSMAFYGDILAQHDARS